MSIVSVVLFLSTTVALLFGAHYFVYTSLVHFFSVTSSVYKYWLMAVLGLLSVSFILSSTLAHFVENSVARMAYFISGFWLGLLVNVLVAFSVAWFFVWVAHLIHFDPNRLLVGVLVTSLAFIFAVYGVWQALHPVVKHVTVRIPDLPESWQGQTLVQLSDIHLGHVYQSGFLKGVVEQVNTLHPKAVVITGDLFDGMDGHLDSLVQPFNMLASEKGAFFITGNHETYLGVDTALLALQGTKVTILKDEVRDVDGLQLIGVNFPLRGEAKKLLPTLKRLHDQFAGRPNVLLYHAPEHIAEVAKSGVDLMLVGHTHQGQQFPFQLVTALVHKGFDYGLYTIGNLTLYTTSGVGTWGPAMRIGTQSEIVALTLEKQ